MEDKKQLKLCLVVTDLPKGVTFSTEGSVGANHGLEYLTTVEEGYLLPAACIDIIPLYAHERMYNGEDDYFDGTVSGKRKMVDSFTPYAASKFTDLALDKAMYIMTVGIERDDVSIIENLIPLFYSYLPLAIENHPEQVGKCIDPEGVENLNFEFVLP